MPCETNTGAFHSSMISMHYPFTYILELLAQTYDVLQLKAKKCLPAHGFERLGASSMRMMRALYYQRNKPGHGPVRML